MDRDAPRILIIAGPNGAGKTTFAKTFLPKEADCLNYVNADLIAAGLAPFQPELVAFQAGRIMLAELERLVAARFNFAFETTLSGRSFARKIPEWQSLGYVVDLIFLKLRTVRLAQRRVRARVRQGGHSIPSSVIRRRFVAGWSNFQFLYRPLVDNWLLYDNSEDVPVLLEQGQKT